MKNVYLFQPQYTVEVSNRLNYWLPYSAGCLWSFAQQFKDVTDNFRLADIVYRREPPEDILERLDNPVYAGFSCYVWNRKYCLEIAKLIKALYPRCVIQFGGPDANGKLLKYDYIDSVVMAEGEETFLETLRAIQNAQPVDDIYSKRRLDNLEIPSPYTTGVFDSIIADNPHIDWAMTLETNRGCPFACTFCDWGGVTYSKIKKFSLERIASELQWAKINNVAYIFCADANFGIFRDRDIAIAELIRDTARDGKLESVNLQYAKNSTETVFEIASIVGNLSRGVTISMQSMNPDTLAAIKRSNLETNNITNLLALSQRKNIGAYTEMIIGLPEETLETWKTGMTELLELGQHYSIDVWFAQLLENSELNTRDSRERYGISSVLAGDYMPYYSNLDYRNIIEEIELIKSTNTMSTTDIVDGYLYAVMIINFHIGGYTQVWARYCRQVLGISYRQFYDELYLKLYDNFKKHFKDLYYTVFMYLSTGYIDRKNTAGHALHTISLSFLYDNREECYNIGQQLAQHFGADGQEVDQLQRNFIFNLNTKYPIQVESKFDLESGESGNFVYQIQDQLRSQNFDFYRARRRGLLKNKLIKLS